MTGWHVILAEKNLKDLAKAPRQERELVLREVNKLAENPFSWNTKKLFDTAYRRRAGNWRIIFTVDFKTNTVRVFSITRRNEKTYRGLY